MKGESVRGSSSNVTFSIHVSASPCRLPQSITNQPQHPSPPTGTFRHRTTTAGRSGSVWDRGSNRRSSFDVSPGFTEVPFWNAESSLLLEPCGSGINRSCIGHGCGCARIGWLQQHAISLITVKSPQSGSITTIVKPQGDSSTRSFVSKYKHNLRPL